jgi:hypothetical protein
MLNRGKDFTPHIRIGPQERSNYRRSAQEVAEGSSNSTWRLLDLALPKTQHLPPGSSQLTDGPYVTGTVTLKLSFPVGYTRLGQRTISTGMQVPKATVDKYNPASIPENDIRPSGQAPNV